MFLKKRKVKIDSDVLETLIRYLEYTGATVINDNIEETVNRILTLYFYTWEDVLYEE